MYVRSDDECELALTEWMLSCIYLGRNKQRLKMQ